MSHGPRVIAADQLRLPAGTWISRLPLIGGVLAAIGLVGCFLLGKDHKAEFYFSWLVAFLFFLSIALGALFFVLVNFATKAGWGIAVRRLAENIVSLLPLFVLLAIPVLMGVHDLYHWSHPEAVAEDHLLQGKEPYLNTSFFYGRAIFYLVVWSLLGWWFSSTSRKQDATGDPALTRKMINVSAPAIAIFALTVTFAAFDWIMSLDPHWYSTIFGVYFFAGCLLSSFAFMILFTLRIQAAGTLGGVVTTEHFHDLGKLLFAFTVFWAYIGFSQYFLIWYGNIPEETMWYLHRFHGNWATVTKVLAIGHFGVPFFFLMPRTIKRSRVLLAVGAVWMLGMHYLDMYWLVQPTHSDSFHPGLLDLCAFLAVGGVFIAGLGWRLPRQSLVPEKDPRLIESLSFENF